MGEIKDFEDFFRSQFGRLAGALGLYCGDVHLADEAAQEAMARAYVRWTTVRELNNPEAWAFSVGRNILRSHFRRLRLARRAQSLDSAEVAVAITDHLALRQFVSELPERQRAVIVLRYFLDRSVAETAEILGWPEGTIKTLSRAAISQLRKVLVPMSTEVDYESR